MLKTLRLAALAAAILTPISRPVWAQSAQRTLQRCHTVEGQAELRRQHPDEVPTDAAFEARIADAIAQEQAQSANSRGFLEVMRIPIVFHVIHTGQAVGTGANIPDAQIYSQLRVLNEDYRRMAGTRGFNTDQRGTDTRIEFVLAKRDPTGQPTNGIDRVNVRNIGVTANPPYNYTTTVMNTIKPQTSWDPTKYFNVWIAAADYNGQLLGIAQFPNNSSLSGMSCTASPGTANTDGVLIDPTCAGSADDGTWTGVDPAAAYGRTLTHESGHWLGLRHIWGDANCGTDYCEDTPIHQSANSLVCPSHPKPNSCGTRDEMFENYMDYTDDRCVNIFTTNQMQRMRAVLKTATRRASLLTSDALIPPTPVDAGLAEILSPLRDLCNGNTSAQVTVKNWGSNALTSVNVSYKINNGSAVTAAQTVNIAPGATATITLNNLSLPAGANTLTFWTSNPNGQTDTIQGLDTLSTVVTVGNGVGLPVGENFEDNDNLPTNWNIVNGGADCKQWRLQSIANGPLGTATTAMSFGFYQNTAAANLEDALVTPVFNLGGDTSAYLIFNLAHQRATTTSSGTLRIDISTDCGLTWQPTPVYSKTGSALSTVTGNSSNTEFFPTAANNWRREIVNLRAFAGQSVRLRLVALNTGGNNLFIDNMLIARGVPVAPDIISFSPDSGAIGSVVNVHGHGFAGATQFAFHNAATLQFQVLNDSTLTAVVPPGAATGHLKVTTPFGVDSTATNFIVLAPPAITRFNPPSGLPPRAVQIFGRGFARVRKVYFNGTAATFSIASDTAISTSVPVGATTGKIALVTRTDSVLSATDFIVGNLFMVRDGGRDTACSGIVVSPGYPGQYDNNQDFTYRIYADSGKLMRLQIVSFASETNYDSLMIYDGPTVVSARKLAKLQGTPTNLPTLTSTGNVLTLRWKSDRSNVAAGFTANVSCVLPPPPTVTTIAPRQGPVGYAFGLQGTNLAAVDRVWFGNVPVTTFSVTATTIVGIVPAGATTSQIRVANSVGSDTTAGLYTVTEGLAYCRPSYAACGSATLQRVVIPQTTLATNTACSDASGPAFTIYPMRDSATGVLMSGGLYRMRVWATSGQNVTAWLDTNRNGVYDDNERLTVSSQPTGTAPGIVLVPVAAGLDSGLIGLRIRSRSGNSTDPCTNSNNGSAAEFTMMVRPCPLVALPTSVLGDTICAGDTASISAQASTLAWWYSDQTGGTLLDTGSVFNPHPTSTTTYYVSNNDGVCQSARVPVTVDVNAAPAATFVVQVNTLLVGQASQAPGNSYQWYRDGQPIAGATSLTYVITDTGNYALQVTNAAGCSTLSLPRLIIPTGVRQNLNAATLTVQPNPSTGRFTVSSHSKSLPLQVLDATGRTVWTGTLNGKVEIDLSRHGNGLYMITAPGLQPMRVVVQ